MYIKSYNLHKNNKPEYFSFSKSNSTPRFCIAPL